MNKKKETRGGYRANARRPLKYDEPTKNVGFKVPVSKVQDFTDKAKQILESYIKPTKMSNKNTYRLQIIQEQFKLNEGDENIREYTEREADSDPKFFNWFFGSDADNIDDFGAGMTDEQKQEWKEFLEELN